MKHDYLATSLWCREEIKDPHQVIARAFDCSDIAVYRKLIKGILLSIYQEKIYRKNSPASLLFDFKIIESVINAAYILNQDGKKNPLDIATSDLFNKNLFCNRIGGRNEWDCFPRSLSVKEYINPYLAFKYFFKYQKIDKWKQDLQVILECAFSTYNEGIEIDLLSVYFHLTKLFEAAHLIDIRENTHISGHIKNRFPNK